MKHPRQSMHRASLVVGFLLSMMFSNGYAACDDPAGPNVDWQGCDKTWLQLQNVDLSNANLAGANLSNSDLEGANLSNADLTGASILGGNLQGVNFTGATVISAFLTKSRIAGAELADAIFDKTHWVNGQPCKEGSIGECKWR